MIIFSVIIVNGDVGETVLDDIKTSSDTAHSKSTVFSERLRINQLLLLRARLRTSLS